MSTLNVPAYEQDLFSDEALTSPYPHYQALRELGPVVWLPEHRVYAAHAVQILLREAGIFVLLRGLHHRTCLQFFGPYVPIDVMVPAAYAEQARSLLNGVLDERFGPAVAEEPHARRPARAGGA